MSNTYEYYGDSDRRAHTDIVNDAIREAVRETGETGWALDTVDHYHAEVYNTDHRKWESEAKVVLRRKA